jgi:hypothetical protein
MLLVSRLYCLEPAGETAREWFAGDCDAERLRKGNLPSEKMNVRTTAR